MFFHKLNYFQLVYVIEDSKLKLLIIVHKLKAVFVFFAVRDLFKEMFVSLHQNS